jgi:AP-3 complex subunit mu
LLLAIVQSKYKKVFFEQKICCFSVQNALPSNQLSTIPWRRLGAKYTNNEAYFDLIEEVDAIIDRNGTTVMCEIQGYVSRTAKGI